MKYYVTIGLQAYYTTVVECDSMEEAKDAANDAFYAADFGDAEDVDVTSIGLESETGECEWV